MDQQYQSEQPEQLPESPRKSKNEAMEWLKAILIAVVLVVLIRWLLFAPFIVDGPSMQPNFHTGERIIVNKVLYDFRQPKYGEVIVFHVPAENRDFIKRVIGVPGDTVKVEGDTVTVNGKVVNETYIQSALDEKHKNNQLYNVEADFPNDEVTEEKVPAGHVFVLGDNRSNSTDSRRIGYVDFSDIKGRADLIFWPMKDIHFIKH
ncbi:signal peptidase I [Paenibacillus shirakamiensis]|uniref:Signal peptidase I n=1 Tax=Paenibacillus shirakamiensis TaxID=1265935 RepID=A0ABS4JHE3_9BACL|nr:signal peptidase I [Paenibacillus shirakamiensis]MBP2001144.1 signal peptidase I [Paenibacillus shirakamiensis]